MKEVLDSQGLAYIFFFFFARNIILEGPFSSGTTSEVLFVWKN